MRAVYVLLALAFCFAVYWVVKPMLHGELSRKPIFAVLQSAEVENKNKSGAILYEERAGYKIAGIINRKGTRIWIVLDVITPEGKLYAIPDKGEAEVECSMVKLLMSQHRVSSDVLKILNSSCVRSL